MSVRVAADFQGRWSCFWATSYTLELELFDEYLFRRLGEPPLNATLLVDFDRLARGLQTIGVEDSRLLRRANRDYLLRGVGLGSGAFHPKTYFFGNQKEGVLLVGSGNLTLRGIEEGHEVFARFESRNEDDLASIRGWRVWMDALTGRISDRDVSLRWLDLKDRCGEWLNGSSEGSRFVHNLERPLLDQLTDNVVGQVEEVHVTAPFYDRQAGALGALCERLKPRRLSLYLGAGTSVDGRALAQVLGASAAAVSVYAVEPSQFVHAKLIGVIQGERGLLLSGSANLSYAALTGTQARSNESWANVEAGVLIGASSVLVRGSFVPLDLELREETLEGIAALDYDTEDDRLTLPVKLRAARLLSDGRVEVELERTAAGEELYASAGLAPQPLHEARTAAPLELPEGGALIWISDAAGAELSNRVPLDDPTRLRDWLRERVGGGERPQGLDPLDYDKPVGRLLQFLHERCIFDIDETDAATRTRRLANEEAGEREGSWDFLEELLKEELRLDPRVERYRTDTGTGLPQDDEILGLLRLMLDRTPSERGLHAVGQPPREEDKGGIGTAWAPERRLQVRLFNVLERWCGALNDPRFRWIDPSAPTRNFSALIVALYECWEQGYLPPPRIEHLLETLYGSYVCTERGPGYLLAIDEDERAAALGRLPREARILGGALAYAVLAPTREWRQTIFAWQPFLTPALELGVIEVGRRVSVLVGRVVGERPATAAIEERLLWACDYLDDEHWCLKQERELGLTDVVLTRESFNPKFGITLAARGATLEDPQLVALVRQALVYRKVDGAVVELEGGRLAVRLGEPIYASVDGTVYESSSPVDADRLAELQRSGVSFGRLVSASDSVAS
jgi:hypothetical protein